MLQWNAESKLFTAELSAPARLALRLFNYPAWRVVDNGQNGASRTRKEPSGQMLVPVDAGPNRVQITFIRTWDRKAGAWVSAIAALAVLIFMFFVGKLNSRNRDYRQ